MRNNPQLVSVALTEDLFRRIPMSIPNLFTITQFSEKHPAFPVGGLRYRIFLAEENGLAKSGAVIRKGGRIYIDECKFFRWLTDDSD